MTLPSWMLERVEQLGWVLVHFCWQGLILGGVLWLLRATMRKQSARSRYGVLCFGMAVCATAPCVTWVVISKNAVTHPRAIVMVRGTAQVAPEVAPAVMEPKRVSLPSTSAAKDEPRRWDWASLNYRIQAWLPVLVKLWAAGVLLLSLKLVYGWLQVGRLRRSGMSVKDVAWKQRFHGLVERMGVRVTVRFLESAAVEIPTVIGWLKPVVLVPVAFLGSLPADQVEAILAHELAHIRRLDYLVNIVQMAVETLLFYHPAIWWLGRAIRQEREYCCDDLAAEIIGDKRIYVEALAALEECRADVGILSLAASGGSLLQRIRRLLGGTPARRSQSSLAPLLIALGLVILCAWGAHHSVAQQAPETNEDPFGNLDLSQGKTDDVRWYQMSFRNAIIDDNLKLVEAFLKHGMKVEPVNLGSPIGDILYDAAYFSRDPKMLQLLLAHGAKPEGDSHDRNATVNKTMRLGNKEMADILIAAGAKYDPICYDAALGEIEDLKKRDAEKPLDAKACKDALEYAASAGQVETFDWLWAKARGDDAAAATKKLADFYKRSASNGNLALLRHLHEMGVKPADGGTEALGYAVSRNHLAEAKYLLENGVALPKDPYVLRNAAGEGYLEMVKLLLDHGADINAKDGEGLTPLAWAAYEGQDDVCLLLVQRGADMEAESKRGETAITYIIGSTHSPKALALVLQKGVHIPDANANGGSLFDAAFSFIPHQPGMTGFPGRVLTMSQLREYEKREEQVIDLLVGAGFDPSGKPGKVTPLKAALRTNHYPAVRALLRHHPDLNVKDDEDNPPIIALFNHCRGRFPLDVLEMFLEQGCDPNKSYPIPNLTPKTEITVLETGLGVFSGSRCGDVEDHRAVIRILLEHGGKFPGVESDAGQALLTAAALGNLQKMQEAIAKGASLDVKEGFGFTPLLISAQLGYFDNVIWLLERGADPKKSHTKLGGSLLPPVVEANRADIVNLLIAKGLEAGQMGSALNEAIESGNSEIFDTLIAAGADPKAGNLFLCIQSGRPEMARVLLQFGVEPQPLPAAENRGNVYWAVYYDQPEILKMLLDHGANPSLVDMYGETPLSRAKKFCKAAVPILEEAIAPRAAEAKKDEVKKDEAK